MKCHGSSDSGKKGLNSVYMCVCLCVYLKIELTGFAEGLAMVCKKKKSQVWPQALWVE